MKDVNGMKMDVQIDINDINNYGFSDLTKNETVFIEKVKRELELMGHKIIGSTEEVIEAYQPGFESYVFLVGVYADEIELIGWHC